MLQLVIQVQLENVRPEFFAVNNDTLKLSFWKLFTKTSFYDKKLVHLKICDCIASDFFLFYPIKLH